MTRTALDVVKELRSGLRTERGEDVELAKSIDELLAQSRFTVFLSGINMTEKEKCPFGCIFYPATDRLYGDCRMPESKDCFLNSRKDKEQEHEQGK